MILGKCKVHSNSYRNHLFFQTDIRLVSGNTLYEGRVEVFYGGTWGTVCDDVWDMQDAHVVCRSLGYGDAVKATVTAKFGKGSGHIILDNVQCTGSERSIWECLHNGFRKDDCLHFEDAGVICKGVV